MILEFGPDISFAFPTPLLRRHLPEAATLNPGLERAILQRMQGEAGRQMSNVGGWHSQGELLDWPEAEIGMLSAAIDSGVQRVWSLAGSQGQSAPRKVTYAAHAWANVNRAGDYNGAHVHPGHHLSAVYYVTTGELSADSVEDGALELRDPRPAASFLQHPGPLSSGSVFLKPKPGLLLIFPAWLEHVVHPYRGGGHRISIAVNIRITEA